MKRYYFRAKYFLMGYKNLSIEDNRNTEYNYWYVENNIIYRNYNDSKHINNVLGKVSDHPIVSKALNIYLIKKRKLKLSKI